jgi:hypothetical protein
LLLPSSERLMGIAVGREPVPPEELPREALRSLLPAPAKEMENN